MPIFAWVLLGLLIYKTGRVPDDVTARLSLFVFRVGMPVVLFFGAAKVDYRQLTQSSYVLAGFLATLSVLCLALGWARIRRMSGDAAAVFSQGAYRANMGVFGVALCAQAYGEDGLALAALPVALLTIVFNIIAVLLLNRAYSTGTSLARSLGDIVRNPLIIGISMGLAVALAGTELPAKLTQAGSLFSKVVLPLALLCIGASLDLRALRHTGWLTLETSLWKLLLTPALTVAIAAALDVQGKALGVLFLLLASPVATASYIMVMAAGGNGAAAANIVVVSTLLSTVTVTIGFTALQLLGMV